MKRVDWHSRKKKNKTDCIKHTNKFTAECVEVLGLQGNVVCDYIEILYIEKVYTWDSEEPVEWVKDSRFPATICSDCFKISEIPPETTEIHVDNSKDMLPLYIKWSLRVNGTADKDGNIDTESHGQNGEKLHRTLSGIYENINGKYRLKNFTEHRCVKCKKEWITFKE